MEPEIGWEEFKTTEKIIQFLSDYKYEGYYRPLPTGLVVDFIAKPQNDFIALKADIDALRVRDQKQVKYRSKSPVVSHACGHDVHTSILCGIAALILELKLELQKNLRLIFQPAEEPIPSGAPKMIDAGVLKNVKMMWGMHVEPSIPLGKISLTEGWVNAHTVRLTWEIQGKGGHSAYPGLTRNPILAASGLIEKVTERVVKKWNIGTTPRILSFTELSSGQAYNVIPDCAVITASLRITSLEDKEIILSQLQSVNRTIERENKVNIQFTVLSGSPPVINDAGIIKKFLVNMEEMEEIKVYKEKIFRSMGGDDFGWYSQKVPSAMVLFGIATGDDTPKLHTGSFDVPVSVLRQAILFFLTQLLRWE
jgi:amidohydrolase